MQNYNSFATLAKSSKVLILTNLFLFVYLSPFKAQSPVAYSGPIIVLDAGHGGADEGAKGNICVEKQVTLALCKKLQNILTDLLPEAAVFFTRQSDTFIPLHQRAKFANDLDADLFISIHCNAMPGNNKHIRGTETYVMGLHKADENLEVAQRENSSILFESPSEDHYTELDLASPASYITLNHFQDQYMQQSISLGKSIESFFSKTHPGKSKGVRQAGFLVLHQVSSPGVLIEAGYMTNPDDERYLCSQSGQEEIALMIAQGIVKHLINSPVHPEIQMIASTAKSGTKPPQTDQYIYKIQLAAMKSYPPEDSKWRKNPDFEIIQDGDLYRVVYGSFLTPTEATEEKQILRRQGFKDAFLIKFLGEKRVD